MNSVETLIPHRPPFLFVDEIVSATEQTIVGTKVFDDSFEIFHGHYPGYQIVPGTILIESLAQCGGAGVRTLGLGGNGLYVLAAIEQARFFVAVEFGATVRMVVTNLRLGGKTLRQSGKAFVGELLVAEATWLCALATQ
jgi:3-hydroxyacyl-[acyl-carrier-protein] dehydratase